MISSSAAPAVSIVAPCYNEAECLREFHRRATAAALASAGEGFEIVLVDDGSRDATWEIISELAADDPHVVGVRLMRNHGHQLAASAGLSLARGDRVMLIDADLQDPPELISDFLSAVRTQDVDVVYGVRGDRSSDSWLKRTTARLYYRLMCRLVGKEIPFDAADFRLVSRRVVDAVNALPEDGRVFRLVIPWLGFPSAEVRYVRAERAAGTTKYNLSKMLRLAFDSVTAFSAAPLRLATWLGLLGGGLSGMFVVGALVIKLTGRSIPGWTSTVLAVSVIGAIQLLCLGLLGEYVARLFQSSQRRPQFLVGYDSLEDQGHQEPVHHR
jgi:polyisoprenyl-phosphate glycosyltransferase